MDILKTVILFLIENSDVIIPLLTLIVGAGVSVASHFAGKSIRLSDIDDVIIDFAKTVKQQAEAKGVSISQITMELLPAEIASKTSRTIEQAKKCFTLEDGVPKLNKTGAIEALATSGDFKKLERKFRKWVKKI